MRLVSIEEIAIGPEGRLFVTPALPPDKDYQFIWRDASSVRWDAGSRCLFVLDIDGFDEVDYFRQIVAAVKNEYGDDLVTWPGTVFNGLPEPVRQRILQYATDAPPS